MPDTSKSKSGINPIAVGAGAIAGAGVAVAATMALKDEKTRQKIAQVAGTIKDKALDYVEKMGEEVEDGKLQARQKLEEVKQKGTKMADSAKKKIDRATSK